MPRPLLPIRTVLVLSLQPGRPPVGHRRNPTLFPAEAEPLWVTRYLLSTLSLVGTLLESIFTALGGLKYLGKEKKCCCARLHIALKPPVSSPMGPQDAEKHPDWLRGRDRHI